MLVHVIPERAWYGNANAYAMYDMQKVRLRHDLESFSQLCVRLYPYSVDVICSINSHSFQGFFLLPPRPRYHSYPCQF